MDEQTVKKEGRRGEGVRGLEEVVGWKRVERMRGGISRVGVDFYIYGTFPKFDGPSTVICNI
jgi:hypothetical protein